MTKLLQKENTALNFIVYFTQMKGLDFSLQEAKIHHRKWLKIQ